MIQKINESHRLDDHGNPAGGTTSGTGLLIQWQDGPLGRGQNRVEPNGAFVEGVIAAAMGRLAFYQTAQDGKYACRENHKAIEALELALLWMEHRTQMREIRKVEGTHQP